MTPVRLKRRFARATCSGACPFATMDAIMAVPVVPRFAPRVNAYICSRRNNPMPHKGVKADVVMEDDWTTIVKPAPTAIAR